MKLPLDKSPRWPRPIYQLMNIWTRMTDSVGLEASARLIRDLKLMEDVEILIEKYIDEDAQG